jgi:hypothetical protein
MNKLLKTFKLGYCNWVYTADFLCRKTTRTELNGKPCVA